MIVTAVIPLHNKADTIGRAVRSVFYQTRTPQALIVIDDGSIDSSAIACRAAMAEAPAAISCQLINQPNAGVSIARNQGAEALCSDMIAFLDADDEWLPGHLAEIERLASAVPHAGLLSTRHARLDVTGQPIPEPSALPRGFFGEVNNGLKTYQQGYGVLHTSTIAVASGAWKRSGGFMAGARKSQDIDLWLRLLLSEPFAHSDVCTGIWHEEATGVVKRSGAVPAHFTRFLGTAEGQKYLSNRDLVGFLSSNLASHVGGHRLRRDDTVVAELLKLSRPLPLADQLRIQLIAKMPRAFLQWVARKRRQARKV